MANRITWTPSTDVVDSYKLLSGSSSTGTFSLMATVPHNLSGTNFDTTTGFFFYDDTIGTTSTWYELVATSGSSDSSPSDPFQAGSTTLVELTTAGRLKEFLNLTTTADDNLLARIVRAASEYFNSAIGYNVLRTVYVETLDGDGSRTLQLKRSPVFEVLSVSVDDQPISARTSVTGSGYVVRRGGIEVTPGLSFTEGIQNVVVRYEAGYSPVPADVEQAVIELGALAYRYRTRVGVLNNSVGGESVGYQTLTLPASITTVIDAYRRMSM